MAGSTSSAELHNPQHNRMCNVGNWDGKFALTHERRLFASQHFIYCMGKPLSLVVGHEYSILSDCHWTMTCLHCADTETVHHQRVLPKKHGLSVCLSTRLGYCVEMMIVRCGMDCWIVLVCRSSEWFEYWRRRRCTEKEKASRKLKITEHHYDHEPKNLCSSRWKSWTQQLPIPMRKSFSCLFG